MGQKQYLLLLIGHDGKLGFYRHIVAPRRLGELGGEHLDLVRMAWGRGLNNGIESGRCGHDDARVSWIQDEVSPRDQYFTRRRYDGGAHV